MASNEELRKQVETLRQRNTSLQREILDNNAHLSRLHENTTNLARFSGSSTPQSGGSVHSGSNTSSPKVSRQQCNLVTQGSLCQSSSAGSSPKVNRHQFSCPPTPQRLNSSGATPGQSSQTVPARGGPSLAMFVSRAQQDSAVNHLSRLQGDGTEAQTADMSESYANDSMIGEHMATLGKSVYDCCVGMGLFEHSVEKTFKLCLFLSAVIQ